jgi:hypothetical protein
MYVTIYAFNMCRRKITKNQCKWTKTHEILIMFNEKPSVIQISNIITHDIMIISQNFILLN